MSLYYPQQPGSPYPPEQGPEEDYYEEGDFEYEEDEFESSGQTWGSRALFFCAGGFLVFLCMSCCVLLGIGLWFLDPGAGATPPPGSDLGLTLEEPAPSFESVVNAQNVRLTIKDINRNAALGTVTPAQGQALMIVTVELVNESDEEISFDERDFRLLSGFGQRYEPISGVVDGALGRGTLPPETGLEGRLVFEVPIGATDLVMQWSGGLDSEPRFIYLP